MHPFEHVRSNLEAVRGRLDRAARAARRDPAAVRLIAISKTFPVDAVLAAPRRARRTSARTASRKPCRRSTRPPILQSGGISSATCSRTRRERPRRICLIHSIDSLDLLRGVEPGGRRGRPRADVLIQVDLRGEETKYGAPRPRSRRSCEERRCTAVRIVGLMLLPPFAENPEDVRPWFRRLRYPARPAAWTKASPPTGSRELSMGMSHDFEVAVEEGSTMVRVGTAIFGERRPPAGTENG